MNKYLLVHWSTKDEVVIEALSWSIENYQHTFYQDEKGKIVQQSYSCRYWDLVDIDYKKI
tara:strand:- start:4809 stop:4988 length:180 start_codon:yes stop_codon:yes gene_type:complete